MIRETASRVFSVAMARLVQPTASLSAGSVRHALCFGGRHSSRNYASGLGHRAVRVSVLSVLIVPDRSLLSLCSAVTTFFCFVDLRATGKRLFIVVYTCSRN